MNVRSVFLAFSLLANGALGFALYQEKSNESASSSNPKETRDAQYYAETEAPVEALSAAEDTRKSLLIATEHETKSEPTTGHSDTNLNEESGHDSSTTNDPYDEWRKAVLENPRVLSAMRKEQLIRTQIEYHPFLNQASLSEAEQAALVNALVNRDMLNIKYGQKQQHESETEYQEINQNIEDLLGPELYKSLEQHETDQSNRWLMMDMRQLLGDNNSSFTVEKERKLTRLLTDIQTEVYHELESSGALTSETSATNAYRDAEIRIYQELQQRSGGFLTPEEQRALDKTMVLMTHQTNTQVLTDALFSGM